MICLCGEFAPHPFHRRWQHPVLKWRTVAQGARLAGQHRHVMPRVIDGLTAAERAGMFGDDPAFLADHDAVGIGMDLLRPSDLTPAVTQSVFRRAKLTP